MDLFPAPDFESDDELLDGYESKVTFGTKIFTDEEYNTLCTNHGLVVDTLTPIKCTANSTVYAAKSPKDGQQWAVKVTDKKRQIESEYVKRTQLEDSPYLLKSVSFRESPKKAILQMELCEDGDIRDMKLSEAECWQLIHNIGSALAVLHHSGWMHLDVSPGNILIGKDCFKLSDFGTLAAVGTFCEGMEGAGPYVSPEALKYPTGFPVTQQTDIFSFGVVLLEAITGIPAPRGGSEAYTAIRNDKLKLGDDKYQAECSLNLKNVINAMLELDPSKRPTAEELASIV